MSILETIHGHGDLISLTPLQQAELCSEIRQFLVNSVSQTGGHLASNLGIVELSVAIETVFDTARDRLVFDVGHQSYVHKILTGRQDAFPTLRQYNGLAGFPKPSESDTDAFVAGHASSSVSIALGMARARTLLQHDYRVIAVMGDGAATGGMAYEALNNASDSKEPLIIILNDNEMSIDKNVGGISRHLSRLRTTHRYIHMKSRFRTVVRKLPGGDGFVHLCTNLKNKLKRAVLQPTIFENMGLQYLGPVDGHDLPELIRILRVALEINQPVIIHAVTRKGYGYTPAENEPARFHGIGKFDVATGKSAPVTDSYSDIFGRTLCKLAAENSAVCAITAAMPAGTGLLPFRSEFPNRFFDVGIAEEHAVSMAGGLAKQGMVPVVAIYSTFLQRAYDQILQDIAMLNLHVVFAVDRADLVGEDGETHHGVFDVGYLSQIPGLTLLAPGNYAELESMLSWAVNVAAGPVAIRYPRGRDELPDSLTAPVCCLRQGQDIALISYGTITREAEAAAELLTKHGISAAVYRMGILSPLPEKSLRETLIQKRVYVIEQAAPGCTIAAQIALCCPEKEIISLAPRNGFVRHGSTAKLLESLSLDANGICKEVVELEK